ncbi:hypothetical protein NE236_41505 [Actinoallomurus purpureus]|uniref:hypothetical protein n=1 Tax=Actinoallomurus purpureus TaxID=478114 RepID=UPI0020922BE8|nr:hypothetical protein [Actinoallomurus purpureus]MCO6011446.1 hypothetical protein [Actinoallomurus purpureus]
MTTVYVSIGNSDDKLRQVDWSLFVNRTVRLIRVYGGVIHGEWYSLPHHRWQNACICFEPIAGSADRIKEQLAKIAARFGQDSIAWAEAPETQFITGTGEATSAR